MTRQTVKRFFRRDLWLTVGPAAALALVAFGVAYYFVKPAPPRTIVMASGQGEGGYRYYFKKYQALLAKQGVKLESHESDGGLENISLLADDSAGVDVAFVQGGTSVPAAEGKGLVSLGALYYQPLWVFYRGEPIDDLVGLRGKRIAVGPADGGTSALAKQLLEAVGVAAPPTELLPLDRAEATKRLAAGEIDAMFVISPAESPAIKRLAATPGVRLLSFARAEAYTRRFQFLKRLVLPRGVLDLAADIPDTDIVLLSPTANLIAKETLHPALAFLLMRAASELHGSAGLLDRAEEFPAALEAGFPLSPEAKRYYKSGAPLLYRYLPFWAANLAERLWVMLVPLIAIFVPLMRLLPPIYRWRVRSRIYRWYARLKELELELEEHPEQVQLEEMLKRLDELDRAVNRIPTPLSYSENLYSFRGHIDLVRTRVLAALKSDGRRPPTAVVA